jgi:hypothetical protein
MKYPVFHPCVTVDKQKMKQCISNLSTPIMSSESNRALWLICRFLACWSHLQWLKTSWAGTRFLAGNEIKRRGTEAVCSSFSFGWFLPGTANISSEDKCVRMRLSGGRGRWGRRFWSAGGAPLLVTRLFSLDVCGFPLFCVSLIFSLELGQIDLLV